MHRFNETDLEMSVLIRIIVQLLYALCRSVNRMLNRKHDII
jgi:hypothetical protein